MREGMKKRRREMQSETPRRGSGAGKIEKDRIDRSNYLAKSATEENRYERDLETLSWKILRHETQSSVPLVPLN